MGCHLQPPGYQEKGIKSLTKPNVGKDMEKPGTLLSERVKTSVEANWHYQVNSHTCIN